MSTQTAAVKHCNHPDCKTVIKPGQLACRSHWSELPKDLRDRLVHVWDLRKKNPDVPELVHLHRTLLLDALRAWHIPEDVILENMRKAPRVMPTACPWCGAAGSIHRAGCNRPTPPVPRMS